MFREEFVGGVARVGSFAGDQFIDHAAHGVDVASGVECASANLLWGHVGAGSFDFRFSSEEFSESSFDFLGDGKVDQFDIPVSAKQDVIGFDIAMNVAFGVQIVEAFGGLFDDARKFISDWFGAASHSHFQVEFAEEFQNDKGSLCIGSVFDQLDDVFVIEFFCDFELVFEKCDFVFVSALFRAEDFQRVAFVVSVEDGFPNLASATESDEASQSVGPEKISYFDHRWTCRCEREVN